MIDRKQLMYSGDTGTNRAKEALDKANLSNVERLGVLQLAHVIEMAYFLENNKHYAFELALKDAIESYESCRMDDTAE